MSPRPVDLRIEELVLRGFPPEARHRIGDAVERELARLFAERDAKRVAPAGGGRIPRVDAGDFPADMPEDEVGARIARTVYKEIYGSSARGGV